MKSIRVIAPVVRQTLNQRVYESLKLLILNGEIAPGTKLNETQVAEQMNTSTTPVREAFRMLSSEGFVKIEPWKGVVVQEYNTDEVLNVFQCREALELLAIELTIEKLKKMENPFTEINLIADAIEISKKSTSLTDFVNHNSNIHNFWINGAGNSRLNVLMDMLSDVLLYDRNMSAMNDTRRLEIIAEHVAILEALCKMDTEAAKEALRYHIRKGYDYGMTIRQKNK